MIAPTTVLDKDGVYVTGLKPMEFRLYDNDKPQTIKVDEISRPSRWWLLSKPITKSKRFCRRFRRSERCCRQWLRATTEKLPCLLRSPIRILQDFTSDPNKITEGLKKAEARQQPGVLTDAVNEAARMLEKRPKERRRVLLLIAESLDKGSEGALAKR